MPPLPNLVKAVHLSAWNTPSWIEEPLAAPHALTPNQCHTIVQEDLSPPLLSLRASGLQNTNSPEGNYIDLYEKNNCRNWKSRVKHSGFCINIPPGGFRSVRYIPPSSPSRNNDTAEVELTEDEKAAVEEQRRADQELDASLLRIEEEFLAAGRITDGKGGN